MEALDRFIPVPRLLESDSVDLALSPERAWELVRHGDLGRSPLVRALFAVRTLSAPGALRIDDLTSTVEPGFRVLADEPGRCVVVGAVGKVWKRRIPFLHVKPEAFASFAEADWVKVAWAIEVAPLGDRDARVTIELRVDATDERAWKKFRRYFRVIGAGSRFIRRSVLAELAREHGTPEAKENERPLPGDELLGDADAQVTDAITIEASPEAIWPWLIQLGCRRGGYYSWDVLDNGGTRSAREIHSELQHVRVGDILPATPRGDAGFEVLAVEPERSLVLGGLWDARDDRQLAFDAERPERFWHVTWSFVLEPLDARRTRLHTRVRAAFPPSGELRFFGLARVHHFMQAAQLRHLAARAEGRMPRDDLRDVLEGAGGAALMLAAMLTPFLRRARSHWGVSEAVAARAYPGDEIVPSPRWSFTHGVEIDAPAEMVWPWIAQIGADRAGFYSYQWLENLAGSDLRNAESIRAGWAHQTGDALLLHPKMPGLALDVAPGRFLLAASPYRPVAGKPWVNVSWLLMVEPLGLFRCRLVSRYRCATSEDLATRVAMGPALFEPLGFAMDRKMLLGVKARAEQRARTASQGPDRSALPRGARA
jgi:hypothetical protein